MSSAARVRACAALSRPWTYVTAPSLVVVAAFARRVCWGSGKRRAENADLHRLERFSHADQIAHAGRDHSHADRNESEFD